MYASVVSEKPDSFCRRERRCVWRKSHPVGIPGAMLHVGIPRDLLTCNVRGERAMDFVRNALFQLNVVELLSRFVCFQIKIVFLEHYIFVIM